MGALNPARSASLDTAFDNGTLTLRLAGWLDAHTIGRVWERSRQALTEHHPRHIIVEAAQVDYCDGAGIAMLVDLRRKQGPQVGVEIRGLAAEYQPLFELFDPSDFQEKTRKKPEPAH